MVIPSQLLLYLHDWMMMLITAHCTLILFQMYFEIILVSPQARGLKEGRTEVKVKMRSLVNDDSCLFGRNNFLDRKYRMQEMYQNYIEGGDWDLQEVGYHEYS